MGYADELFDLTDRVILITGGSRGLGREMAFAAAHCGAADEPDHHRTGIAAADFSDGGGGTAA